MIYGDIMNMMPNDWYPMDPDLRYDCTIVPEGSSEFNNLLPQFEGHYFRCITGLYKVRNPLLWAKYQLKTEEYNRRGPYNIQYLYHDTDVININSIAEFNFDWRMGERFMFGPGVYFSVHPDIAYKHSSKKNGYSRAMFLVDVLVQNVQIGNGNIILPDSGFDTVIAHNHQTYVKYFDSEYYPGYFITYEARDK